MNRKQQQDILYLIVFIVYGIGITVVSQNIPFFWDTILISWTGHFFYENNFNGFIVPAELDFGHIPFYGYYLSVWWKILGRTLWVSHLAMFPFIVGLHYAVYLLSKKFISGGGLMFFSLLIIANPVILTQEILMAYDIVLACFFFWAFIMLKQEKRFLYTLFLILMLMTSARGIYLVFALFIYDIIFNLRQINDNFIKKLFPYLIFMVVFIGWFIYHKMKTGWYFFSPELQQTDRKIVDILMFLRQTGYIFWKLLDLGNVAIFASAIIGFFYLSKHKMLNSEIKRLSFFLVIVILVMVLGMAILSNPIGHKYFIVVYGLATIIATAILQNIKKHVHRWLAYMFVLIILFSGNYWLYPVRYGNGWDCSLKVLPFFRLEKQMRNYILSKNINTCEVATHFPLYAGTKFSQLDDVDLSYQIINEDKINTYKYILYSNVSNKFKTSTINELKKNWISLKKLNCGLVHLNLYKNPNF